MRREGTHRILSSDPDDHPVSVPGLSDQLIIRPKDVSVRFEILPSYRVSVLIYALLSDVDSDWTGKG